ncbi:hypothetical protein [Persephonella sp.]
MRKDKKIREILEEEKEALERRLSVLNRAIKMLPKGWIKVVKKGRKKYRYLYTSVRKDGKVKSVYVGKVDRETEELLNRRRELELEVKLIKKKLKVLEEILKKVEKD